MAFIVASPCGCCCCASLSTQRAVCAVSAGRRGASAVRVAPWRVLARPAFAGDPVRVLRAVGGAVGAGVRMNVSSNDFRTGTTIELDGTVFRVLEFLHVKPGKGAAFVRTKLKNLKTGNNMEKTFKAGEMVPSAQLDKVVMQHTYQDGDDFVFMNMESFEEERLNSAAMGERVTMYLMEGMEVEVLKHNDDVLGVDIPKTMVFTVTETDPGVKGNTVQGGVKPATLECGAVINVPLFIAEGEKIMVNTEENSYTGRFNG